MDLLDKLTHKKGDDIPPMPEGSGNMENNSPPPPPPPEPESGSGLPVDQIIQMRGQGFNDNQIIQVLQRDGFNSSQVFDAFNQVNLKGGSSMQQAGFQGNPQKGPQSAQPMPPPMPPPMNPPMGSPSQHDSSSRSDDNFDREKIEELAEVIIDEKWEELIKSLNKIVEWKDSTEVRIGKIEQQFKDIKSDFDNLHKAIIGKIGEYDQNILNVGTEIKAMEKVFQKILPAFTENVAELSRVTKKMKGSPKSASKKK